VDDLHHDELDYDELEELHAELHDYLLASDLVGLAERDPDEASETIARLFAVIRHVAGAVGGAALVLRRQPMLIDRVARDLGMLAGMLDELVLGENVNPLD
jgi:hypothetical protein